MKRSRAAVAGGTALLAGVLAVMSIDPPGAPVHNPARSELDRLVRGVYGAAVTTARVPVDAGVREVAVGSLTGFVQALPLAPDVQERVLARVRSDVLVDDLVPFLLFMKSLYDHRKAGIHGFGPATASAPDPAPGEASAGPGLPSPQAIARLVTLYDAIWLADAAPGAPLDRTMRCGRGEDDLRARSAAAAPIVSELLGELALDGEPGAALDHVRADPAVLRTVTTSLVELVDAEICKHYAVFASRAARRAELAAFLDRGLASDPVDPAVWDWLAWADARPLGVHVIVDGLQGHLVDALVRRDAAWFQGVLAAHDVPKPRQRSARPGPPMVLDALRGYAEGRGFPELPAFAAAFTGNGVARAGLSTTPTISVRNLPLVMTGAAVAGPHGTGIPNFHFVDRAFVHPTTGARGRPWYFYGNDALQLTALTRASGMRTMFERLGHLDTMSCGSQYDERAGYSFDGFLNLAVGERLRDFGEALCADALAERAAVERELRELRARLAELRPILAVHHRPWELYDRAIAAEARAEAHELAARIAERSVDGLPDYLQWYDPWPDHFAHAVGPYADAIVGPRGEYARLDYWLGRVGAAYAEAGVADRTLFAMAGDHGLTPVLWVVSPEIEVFEALDRALAGSGGLVVRKISSDEGEGPKLTDRFDPPPMTGIDLVVASTAGGNYMIDAFVDQAERWSQQPLAADLRHWRTLGGHELDLVGEITARLGSSLAYAVVRESACDPARCAIALVRQPDGGAPQTMRITRVGDRIRVDGDDLLGVDLSCADPHPDGCTEADWTARTARSARPDAVVQLAHLYDTDRAGTINLFPVAGVGYNTVVPGRHAGETFAEKDAFVGVWGAPVHRSAPPDHATNAQIAPTVYAWLTGEQPRAGVDGWGYDPVPWQ